MIVLSAVDSNDVLMGLRIELHYGQTCKGRTAVECTLDA